MSKKKLSIEDIFEDDDLGILESKSSKTSVKSEDQRLVDSFEEINSFIDSNGKEPEQGSRISEMRLQLRLQGFRSSDHKKEILKPYDRHNLLFQKQTPKSVTDIFDDDELDILNPDAEAESIFEFNHTPKNSERAETDFVAQRKPLTDQEFEPYKKLFQKVHKEIKSGRRTLKEFRKADKNLKEKHFYIVDGMLCYLEMADISLVEMGDKSGKRLRKEGRTRTVFDNGTYSNMLYRSLGKILSKNGRIVSDTDEAAENELAANATQVEPEDVESGWIYVLRSKSKNPEIASVKNLHKIGFSTVDVKRRIVNAANQSTYLNADVEIVATFRCLNLNTQKFENLIHRFFKDVQLQIDILSRGNQRVSPREWFVVPFPIIERVVELFISGEIVDYRYDVENEGILKVMP